MHLTLTPLTTKKIEADVQFIHTANTFNAQQASAAVIVYGRTVEIIGRTAYIFLSYRIVVYVFSAFA